MKRILQLFIAIICVQYLGAKVSSSLTTIMVDGDTRSAFFIVTADKKWWITNYNIDPWMTISPRSGEAGTYRVEVIFKEQNATGTTRKRKMKLIESGNPDTIAIMVKQRSLEEKAASGATTFTFSAGYPKAQTVTLNLSDAVTITKTNASWMTFSGLGSSAAAGQLTFVACPNTFNTSTTNSRVATVTFKEQTSGEESTLTFTQEAFIPSSGVGMSAHWEKSTLTGNKCYAYVGNGKNKSYFEPVSVNSKNIILGHKVYGITDGVSFQNMKSGDYILFHVPAKRLNAHSTVFFGCTMGAHGPHTPQYWIFEYYEDGQWKTVPQDVYSTTVNGQTFNYSFRTYYKSGMSSSEQQLATFSQEFPITKDIIDGELQCRIRAAANVNMYNNDIKMSDTTAYTFLGRSTYWMAYMEYVDNTLVPIKDYRNLSFVGNSFTYYHESPWQLAAIALSQGHEIHEHGFIKGGQSIKQLTTFQLTKDCQNIGNFDYVIMQPQSSVIAKYGKSSSSTTVCTDTKTMRDAYKKKSPNARYFVEQGWSCSESNYYGFGSYEAYDKYSLIGAKAIANSLGIEMSPVGVAFKNARAAGFTPTGKYKQTLYHTDNHHPSRYGAYLKSCVNYLVLFGEPFHGTVPNCGCDETKAAALRKIAEETVLGNESTYYINRTR